MLSCHSSGPHADEWTHLMKPELAASVPRGATAVNARECAAKSDFGASIGRGSSRHRKPTANKTVRTAKIQNAN